MYTLLNLEDVLVIIFIVIMAVLYGYYAENIKGISWKNLCLALNGRREIPEKEENIHYLHVYRSLKEIYGSETGMITKLQREIMFHTSKLNLKPNKERLFSRMYTKVNKLGLNVGNGFRIAMRRYYFYKERINSLR